MTPHKHFQKNDISLDAENLGSAWRSKQIPQSRALKLRDISYSLESFCLDVKHKDNTGILDFPGGPVLKNPPANAGNTGAISGPRRFHIPQSN